MFIHEQHVHCLVIELTELCYALECCDINRAIEMLALKKINKNSARSLNFHCLFIF